MLMAGLDGIERGLEPPARFDGNAYAAKDLPRIPSDIVDATRAFEASDLALDAFGEAVHAHLLNTARQEWAAFGNVVTDWERRRGFVQY
jgi:glutamine synthetase